MGELIIAGIDPGTTLGYAVLDINGKIIELGSSKNIGFDEWVSKIARLGRVLAVGCDKANVPDFVERFRIKVGAKLVKPNYDLSVRQKKEFTNKFETGNDHERDALASAVFAFKKITPLLKKIDQFAKANRKEPLKKKITCSVILDEKSILHSARSFEEPKQEDIILENIKEAKVPDKNGLLRLYDQIKRMGAELSILREHNSHLQNKIKNLEGKEKYFLRKLDQASSKRKGQELLNFMEKRIKSFSNELNLKRIEGDKLRREIRGLNYFLSSLNENYLVKKVQDLGAGFGESKDLLNIMKGDILLLDNANILSEKTINYLNGKVDIILYRGKLPKKQQELPFFLISSSKFNIEENKHFALVKKEDLDRERKSLDVLRKIINKYKKER